MANVKLNEYEFPENKLAKVQSQFEKLVENNYFLYNAAKCAYRSYIQAYNSHSLKDVFDVKDIDLQKSALSFGLKVPPKVCLDVSLKRKKIQKRFGKEKNFLDKRYQKKDKRQFSR